MKKTAKIEVRLPDEEKNAFSAACEARGETVSEVVRKLIQQRNRPRHRSVLFGSLLAMFLSIGLIGTIATLNGPSQAQPYSTILVMFELMDADQNGSIEKPEYFAFYDTGDTSSVERPTISEVLRAQFMTEDTNADGNISQHEFIGNFRQQSERIFIGLDLNGDQSLSIDEVMPRDEDKAMHNNREAILAWSAKVNGVAFGRGISAEDGRSWDLTPWYWSDAGDVPEAYLARAGELFASYDANSNGRISKEEYLAAEMR